MHGYLCQFLRMVDEKRYVDAQRLSKESKLPKGFLEQLSSFLGSDALSATVLKMEPNNKLITEYQPVLHQMAELKSRELEEKEAEDTEDDEVESEGKE